MLKPEKCENAAEMEGVAELPPGFREATIAFLEAIRDVSFVVVVLHTEFSVTVCEEALFFSSDIAYQKKQRFALLIFCWVREATGLCV